MTEISEMKTKPKGLVNPKTTPNIKRATRIYVNVMLKLKRSAAITESPLNIMKHFFLPK